VHASDLQLAIYDQRQAQYRYQVDIYYQKIIGLEVQLTRSEHDVRAFSSRLQIATALEAKRRARTIAGRHPDQWLGAEDLRIEMQHNPTDATAAAADIPSAIHFLGVLKEAGLGTPLTSGRRSAYTRRLQNGMSGQRSTGSTGPASGAECRAVSGRGINLTAASGSGQGTPKPLLNSGYPSAQRRDLPLKYVEAASLLPTAAEAAHAVVARTLSQPYLVGSGVECWLRRAAERLMTSHTPAASYPWQDADGTSAWSYIGRAKAALRFHREKLGLAARGYWLGDP
jgi:hypothetical protein